MMRIFEQVRGFSVIKFWTFWNMNSSVWAVLAAQGSKEEKVDLRFSERILRFSEQLLRVVFFIFLWPKKI